MVRKGACRVVHMALAVACVTIGLSASSQAEPATPTGEVRQPRNIYELVYGVEHTFVNVLSREEWKEFTAKTPEEIRESNPRLYDRISRDVKGWTDEWIHHVRTSLVPIPEKRLLAARAKAERVDAVLKSHFAVKGLPYKPLKVVFLPPQVFLDERHRENLTSGMFIPFYPDAFFTSVDWPVPMELVLVHESLHFNKTGTPYGRPLLEGITETASCYLSLKYELLTARAINRAQSYPQERKGVDLILSEIIKRASVSRDDAIDLFLEAYLTGRQDEMIKIFGAEPWSRVLSLSGSDEDWQTHKIAKALER